jgi:hypothetical protein
VVLFLIAAAVAACLLWRGIGRANRETDEVVGPDVEMSTDIVLEPSDDGEHSDQFGTFENMLEPSSDADQIYGEFGGSFQFGE